MFEGLLRKVEENVVRMGPLPYGFRRCANGLSCVGKRKRSPKSRGSIDSSGGEKQVILYRTFLGCRNDVVSAAEYSSALVSDFHSDPL